MIVPYEEKYREGCKKLLQEEKQAFFFNPHFEKFLAVEGEEIKGWIVLEQSGDRLLIEWIYIFEQHRRQGIGRKLVQKAIELGREQSMRGVSVCTGSKNREAQLFYKNLNFREVGKVKEYFSFDPEHIFYWYRL